MPKKYKFKFNWVVNRKLAIGTCPRYEEDLVKIKDNQIKSIFGLCDPSEAIYAVFLHCVAAMERSPLVCMAWLIKHKNLSITQSLDYMMSINKGTNPLPSQLKVLNDPILK